MISKFSIAKNMRTTDYVNDYNSMLVDVIKKTRVEHNFLELYYLSNDKEIADSIWKFAKLSPAQRRVFSSLLDEFIALHEHLSLSAPEIDKYKVETEIAPSNVTPPLQADSWPARS
jgi:hypothetical protein